MLAVADDLTGAAEVAAVLGSRRIVLRGAAREGDTVDLDSRELQPAAAAARVRELLAQHPGELVFKKIDSQLRGNVAAEIEALGADVVVAPALPALGRIVRGGMLHVDGAAPRPAPIAVRDAETDADLDALVAEALGRGARLAGSAGLAAALGRRLGAAPLPPPAAVRGRGPLVVVGTREERAAAQVARLESAGVRGVALAADALPEGAGDAARLVVRALADGPVVLRLTGEAPPGLARRLGAFVAGLVRDAPVDLVLTGGETARKVLDALDVAELEPVAQVQHGAVVSVTPDRRRVTTRPGSFGGLDSLVRIVEATTA